MKLKHLVALVVLLAVGCTQQPASESSSPAADTDNSTAAVGSGDSVTATVEPETETQLASTTVSFDVTGMT